jgi:hypothetical protein
VQLWRRPQAGNGFGPEDHLPQPSTAAAHTTAGREGAQRRSRRRRPRGRTAAQPQSEDQEDAQRHQPRASTHTASSTAAQPPSEGHEDAPRHRPRAKRHTSQHKRGKPQAPDAERERDTPHTPKSPRQAGVRQGVHGSVTTEPTGNVETNRAPEGFDLHATENGAGQPPNTDVNLKRNPAAQQDAKLTQGTTICKCGKKSSESSTPGAAALGPALREL